MQGAQKAEPRGVYEYTLSGAVCSATQQMSVFQQPHYLAFSSGQVHISHCRAPFFRSMAASGQVSIQQKHLIHFL
jgi:hypothetical protein